MPQAMQPKKPRASAEQAQGDAFISRKVRQTSDDLDDCAHNQLGMLDALLVRSIRVGVSVGKRLGGRNIALAAGGLATIAAALFVIAVGLRIYRVETTRQAIVQAGGEVEWAHEQRVPMHPKNALNPTKVHRTLAKWLGPATVSSLAKVRLPDQASDEEIGFVDQLYEVRELVLRSDFATDRTLEKLSRLPNLRKLTLAGRNFTVAGLLQLRTLPCLEQLNLNAPHLEPIEAAVIRAEVPQTQLAQRHGIRDYSDALEPIWIL